MRETDKKREGEMEREIERKSMKPMEKNETKHKQPERKKEIK